MQIYIYIYLLQFSVIFPPPLIAILFLFSLLFSLIFLFSLFSSLFISSLFFFSVYLFSLLFFYLFSFFSSLFISSLFYLLFFLFSFISSSLFYLFSSLFISSLSRVRGSALLCGLEGPGGDDPWAPSPPPRLGLGWVTWAAKGKICYSGQSKL